KELSPLPLKRDLLIKSSSICNLTSANMKNAPSPFGAGFCDTSEYMVGNISVTIIFPESQGEGAENTEDWDLYADQYVFLTRVEDAMDWWVKKDPAAKLCFYYEWMTKPVSIEPINHNYCQEKVWSAEIMTDLGFNKYENYLDNVRDFNNAQREKYKTDWAFTIFPVNANKDSDGFFKKDIDPDCPGSDFSWFAWSWLGGPLSVIAYKKSHDTSNNTPFNAVVAHETAHIFYALDEYIGSGSYCTQRSGYLDVENQNYEDNCLLNELCIMRSYASVAFYQNKLCQYTREQIGWRDSDQDGIFDILDFDPESRIITISSTPSPTLRGIADCSKTLPNKNTYESGGDITINNIAKVELRIDKSDWISAAPEDGRFDSPLENFDIKLASPSSGNHDVEIKTVTNFGNETINSFQDVFTTENLYFPITNTNNMTTILIASNFSPSTSEYIFSFTRATNNAEETTTISLAPNQTKYMDLHAFGIEETGSGKITKTPASEIEFYAYSLNNETFQSHELQVKKPIFEEGVIPLWIVNSSIKTTSYFYIQNVGLETSDFEIIIKDKTSKTQKDISLSLAASEKKVINIQDHFDNDSQGHILIYSEGCSFTAHCVILKENFEIITLIQGIEKSWK
ncbi:hypothetical protein KKB18_02090, partial [bacterium]|nr:hypothetical protein [bacterium]